MSTSVRERDCPRRDKGLAAEPMTRAKKSSTSSWRSAFTFQSASHACDAKLRAPPPVGVPVTARSYVTDCGGDRSTTKDDAQIVPGQVLQILAEKGAPFSTAGFAKLVEQAGTEAGLKFTVHAHMMRHACGYALAHAGHDTRSLASLSRTQRLSTTSHSMSAIAAIGSEAQDHEHGAGSG